MPGSLASGHVTTRQIWPLRDLVGDQDEVAPAGAISLPPMRPQDHAGDAQQDDEDGRADVERADPEPRVAGVAALRHREREAAGHGIPTVSSNNRW